MPNFFIYHRHDQGGGGGGNWAGNDTTCTKDATFLFFFSHDLLHYRYFSLKRKSSRIALKSTF